MGFFVVKTTLNQRFLIYLIGKLFPTVLAEYLCQLFI